eukprot:1501350-Heterocapsa_arctica.AAC.1
MRGRTSLQIHSAHSERTESMSAIRSTRKVPALMISLYMGQDDIKLLFASLLPGVTASGCGF